jgi:hypothetical protein
MAGFLGEGEDAVSGADRDDDFFNLGWHGGFLLLGDGFLVEVDPANLTVAGVDFVDADETLLIGGTRGYTTVGKGDLATLADDGGAGFVLEFHSNPMGLVLVFFGVFVVGVFAVGVFGVGFVGLATAGGGVSLIPRAEEPPKDSGTSSRAESQLSSPSRHRRASAVTRFSAIQSMSIWVVAGPYCPPLGGRTYHRESIRGRRLGGMLGWPLASGAGFRGLAGGLLVLA